MNLDDVILVETPSPKLAALRDLVADLRTQGVPIDGVGNILGSAGPCFLRSDGTNMPVLAQMRFDEADIAGMVTNGTLNDVILHEMHHALGFGTIWGLSTPALRVRTGTALSAFVGSNAITACKALGGLSTACDSASMPVAAVNKGGRPTVSCGSSKATLGTRCQE